MNKPEEQYKQRNEEQCSPFACNLAGARTVCSPRFVYGAGPVLHGEPKEATIGTETEEKHYALPESTRSRRAQCRKEGNDVQVLQLFFDHFWLVVLFLFFFGGSIWAAIEWTIRRSLKHRERMQVLKNEELRLQLQIAQVNKKKSKQDPLHSPTSPTPKEAAWEERGDPVCETGYQQQSR